MLTPPQSQILNFIRQSYRKVGVPPTLREIQVRFGYASSTAAVGHVKALVRKGALIRTATGTRCYLPAGEKTAATDGAMMDIPLLGTIPAGLSVSVEEATEEMLSISRRTLGTGENARIFALRVKGDSMIGARIFDGDIVFLDQDREPKPKSVVAALIDGEVTLKTYMLQANGEAYLRPENPAFPQMVPAHDLLIQGVKVALLRRDSVE